MSANPPPTKQQSTRKKTKQTSNWEAENEIAALQRFRIYMMSNDVRSVVFLFPRGARKTTGRGVAENSMTFGQEKAGGIIFDRISQGLMAVVVSGLKGCAV